MRTRAGNIIFAFLLILQENQQKFKSVSFNRTYIFTQGSSSLQFYITVLHSFARQVNKPKRKGRADDSTAFLFEFLPHFLLPPLILCASSQTLPITTPKQISIASHMYSRFVTRSAAHLRLPPTTCAPKPRRQFTMSSTTFSNSNFEPESPSNSAKKETLALPEMPYNNTTQLDMSNGNTTIKLDHLGPMVVNVDGSLGRITNWDGMTEMEKKNTLRIVGKRNQARLDVLRAKEGVNGKE